VPLFDGLLNYRTKPDDRPLTDDEIADELTCAFIANTETPGKVAAQGLLELSRRPGQLAQLREDLPKNVPIATEEMLRLPRASAMVPEDDPRGYGDRRGAHEGRSARCGPHHFREPGRARIREFGGLHLESADSQAAG
jgi:hypothetical protein